jgi:hypothetical protein
MLEARAEADMAIIAASAAMKICHHPCRASVVFWRRNPHASQVASRPRRTAGLSLENGAYLT